MVVPSAFCKDVFERCGLAIPIEVVPHGVADSYVYWGGLDDPYASPDARSLPRLTTDTKDGVVRLLHVSGAVSYPQRKGTPQLLTAFRRLVRNPKYANVLLYLKMVKTPGLVESIHALGLDANVRVLPDKSIPPDMMVRLLQAFDAVVQPARGEGFGIVPLEARCAGIPNALTRSTGHSEHFEEGLDVEIETGTPERLVTLGNDEGYCPSLSAEAVYVALVKLIDNLPEHKKKARAWSKANAEKWTWTNVLAPWAVETTALARQTSDANRAGAEAGLLGTTG